MLAHFTYYGSTEAKSKEVKFYRRPNGLYVCEIEGMPALKVSHPSRIRVMAAFKGWHEMAIKDWGASEIEWDGMATSDEQEEAVWNQLGKGKQ